MLTTKLFRCSSLFNLVPEPKKRGEVLSQTAKSYIRSVVKEDAFGFSSFLGNRKTEKGNVLEAMAIKQSGDLRFTTYEKNEIRAKTSLISGEADVIDLDRRVILDTKCSWDIGTHPFFKEEAQEKAVKAGYDIQLHGYFMAFEQYYREQGIEITFEHGEIDFWLFPCPEELLSQYDDDHRLIELVEAIPLEKRCTTIKIERNEAILARIEEVIPHAQRYYKLLQIELAGDNF